MVHSIACFHGGTRILHPSVTSKPSTIKKITTRVKKAYAYPKAMDFQSVKVRESLKLDLLRATQNTQRGFSASSEQRAAIEEAMVNVEKWDAGEGIDLDVLDGTWLLQYTSAPDVLMLLQAATLPFLKVGQIYQKFECKGCKGGGIIRNIVYWSIPGILQETDGATLLVTAKFSSLTQRNIALSFEKVACGQLMISDQLQALLAPAFLPRTAFNLEILQFLRGFKTEYQFTSSNEKEDKKKIALNSVSPGGVYYLSYLDNDMLLGRALGGGGVFIFRRTQPMLLQI